jgi:hypothetical protein
MHAIWAADAIGIAASFAVAPSILPPLQCALLVLLAALLSDHVPRPRHRCGPSTEHGVGLVSAKNIKLFVFCFVVETICHRTRVNKQTAAYWSPRAMPVPDTLDGAGMLPTVMSLAASWNDLPR